MSEFYTITARYFCLPNLGDVHTPPAPPPFPLPMNKQIATCNNSAESMTRDVARNLFRRGTKQGDWGQKSPSGVQGQRPGGGGAKTPRS